MYNPIVKSYFSGAGGTDLGLSQAGCKVIESLEIDTACCHTLKANFEHKVCQRDIRNETVTDKEDCDLMAITFPCNKYSTIANIHDTRTGDELFLHAFRHVALKRPEGFFVENVTGMRKFKVVMECFTKIPEYYTQVFCPLNASVWLPQNRARLIVIATKKKFAIQEPVQHSSRISLKDIIEKNPEIEIPEYVYSRLAGKYRDKPIISDPDNKHELAPTAVAHYSKDIGTRLLKDKNFPMHVRPYTVREYARLQGFPDSFKFPGSDAEAYKQIGNAVAVPMARWIGQQFINYFN